MCKRNAHSDSKQLTVANSSMAQAWSSCPTPIAMLGCGLTRACTGFVDTTVPAVPSYVPLPWCTTLFLCSYPLSSDFLHSCFFLFPSDLPCRAEHSPISVSGSWLLWASLLITIYCR